MFDIAKEIQKETERYLNAEQDAVSVRTAPLSVGCGSLASAPINATPPTSSPAPVSPKLSEAASVGVAPDYYDQERADNREEYARLDELARSGCYDE